MEFIAGILFSPVMLTVLVILSIVLDHKDAKGGVIFFGLLAGIIAFFMYNISWQQLLMIVGAWFPIGLVWSVWRWKRHCSKIVKKVREESYSRDIAKDRIDPSRNKGTLVYWVFAWPFSFIEMIIGDIIDMVEVLVTKVFRGTYAKISANALVDIEDHNKNG